MTLRDLLFDPDTDQVSIVENCVDQYTAFAKAGAEDIEIASLVSCRGALKGGSLKNLSRYGDKQNRLSIGTASVFISKGAFREGSPYYKQYVGDVVEIIPTYHFLLELRRQLTGEVVDSRFSDVEELFYTEYKEWNDGVVKEGLVLQAIETLDTWLIDELMGNVHPQLNRDYGSTHKWNKLEERV